MTEQQLVLVNEKDEPVGVMNKMEVHQKGILHRAFSVFIFNRKGEMLLQQRAANKYHSANLWTNACCSHPSPGEETIDAAKRRLQEEMGFSTTLHEVFSFLYKADFDNGLTEYEFDHVLTGEYEGPIHLNKEEAKDHCFKSMLQIKQSLTTHPEKYTAWFRIAFPRIESWWSRHYNNVAV